ncbi:hypothetical protein [Fusobacterium sp. THCT1E2]
MKKIDLMAKDATKMFMVKKLLGKGLKIEEIENELSIKDLFSYMQYNASEFSNFKFKKEKYQ